MIKGFPLCTYYPIFNWDQLNVYHEYCQFAWSQAKWASTKWCSSDYKHFSVFLNLVALNLFWCQNIRSFTVLDKSPISLSLWLFLSLVIPALFAILPDSSRLNELLFPISQWIHWDASFVCSGSACHRRSATHPRLLLLLPRCSSLPCRHRRPATRLCLLLLLPHRSLLPCRHLRPPTRPCLLLLQRLRGLSRQRPAHLLKHYLGWCCAAGALRWRAAMAAGACLWTAHAAAREGEDEPRQPKLAATERESAGGWGRRRPTSIHGTDEQVR
jgi:hypothetical protein